jgi:phosphoglycerol transferase
MFLPESMYFFGLSIVALLVANIADGFNTWRNWAFVGVAIGITSLVKPHAWLTFMSLVIFLLVLSLENRKIFLPTIAKNFAGLVIGAILSRVIFGLLVAGPKALGFFGIYLGVGIVDELSLPPSQEVAPVSPVGTTPLNGAISLFPIQITTHLVSLFALTAVMLCALALSIWQVIKKKKAQGLLGFSLFIIVWTFSLLISIVLFSGWITGGGDDHTTRVLLRYYDFVYVFIPLVGLALLNQKEVITVPAWLRWTLAMTSLGVITTSFTGYFGSLTIQIADAPNLAGLVVDLTTFNGTATMMAISLVVFATFPRFTKYAAAVTLIFSMVFTGWQIQEQYRLFRQTESVADISGKRVREIVSSSSDAVVQVIGSSRFESTNASFWIDRRSTIYEVLPPNTVHPAQEIDSKVSVILSLSGIQVENTGQLELIESGEGYNVWQQTQ